MVAADTSIVVNEVHYDVAEKNETVEALDKVILDPSLTSGVQETTEGNDGEGIFTYTTRYVNGRKKGTERELKEWITEPHDNVLRLGTSATGQSGEYTVAMTFIANTTAYTARAGARGALGMGVHYGTCAVDPRFVSLRSELWVEGYGYAFACDTGGAVKGNVVDLYMNSRGACVSWGRRNKTAYVIIPAE
jgi:3D (Asp-Asp-Asp) domain-containing protein